MKIYAKIIATLMLTACFSLSSISCKQKDNIMFVPTGGGGGGTTVSATAVMINGITEALNYYYWYYTAYNNAGYGLALWCSLAGNISHVVYSLYNPDTGAWSAPVEFVRNSEQFKVASNGTGFMVVYAVGQVIYARPWSGGTFGATVKISGSSTTCYDPMIGSNGSGYCAVWSQRVIDRYNMHAAIYNGTSWSSPAELDTSPEAPSNYKITSNGSGYCVNWNEGRLFASVHNGVSWSSAEAVDNGAVPTSYSIAANASRYIIVFQDSSNDIYASVYNAGWTVGTSLESGIDTARNPDIAGYGDTMCCVWHQYDVDVYKIFARIYDNDTGWGAAEVLSLTAHAAYNPKVAADGSSYCAVWQSHDGISNKIYASRYNGTWSAPAVVNPLNTAGSATPYVYANSSGYMAHWDETVSGQTRIGSSVYTGSAWSSVSLIDAEYHSNVYLLAYPFTGGYGFSYSYADPAGNGIMANVYRNNAWSGAVDLGAGKLKGSCLTNNVPVLYRAGSATIAVWWQFDKASDGSYKLYASVKTGSSWGAPLLIEDDITDYYAAVNGSDFCVVWTTVDSLATRTILLGRIYSGGAWGPEALLDNDIVNRDSQHPRVAGNGSGNDFCVTWQQNDGAEYSIYANFHTASGWGTSPFTPIDNGGFGQAEWPEVMAGDSYYCVVFEQNARTYGTVYTSSWSTPEELDGANQFSPTRRTMAASGGQFAVANFRSSNIYANVFDGSSWSGMVLLDYVDTNNAYEPAVAGNGLGGFCLAWYEGVSTQMAMTRIYDGSDWGEAESCNYFDDYLNTYNAYNPLLASNGTGYAVVFMQYNEYWTGNLYSNVYDSGSASWFGADLLDDFITSVDTGYSIVSNGTGYGVTWRQWSADGVRMAYGTAYSGGEWNSKVLSNGNGDVENPDAVWSGSSYTAAWMQTDGDDSAVFDLWSDTFR